MSLFPPGEMFASESGKRALFTFNGSFGALRTLHKLRSQIESGVAKRGCNALPFTFLSQIKENTSLTEFFDNIYEEIAQCVHLPRECNGQVLLSHKMFPCYADGNREYILPHLSSDDRAIVHLQRNEKRRQQSCIRRFPNFAPRHWDGKNVSYWDQFLNNQEHRGSFSSAFYTHVHTEHLWPTATSYDKTLQSIFEAFHFERQDSLMQAVYHEVERFYGQADARQMLELQD